jgi:hypothetical protein
MQMNYSFDWQMFDLPLRQIKDSTDFVHVQSNILPLDFKFYCFYCPRDGIQTELLTDFA